MHISKKLRSIKHWKEDDRPREKLMQKGKTVLSNAELVAVLISSGNRQESAVDLSKRILANVNNNLNALAKLNVENLCTFKGIGPAKAISIITALELGKRRRLEKALIQTKITTSKSVFKIMQPIIGDLLYEEFWVIYLDNANKVITKTQLSKGGITGTLVDTRLVFKKAIEVSAVGIILCHNHPSEKIKPSIADRELTKKIKNAGKTLDIKVFDHLIIALNAYFSFADEGIL
ncbi:MAG: DNA repair protein RadC [Flavobacteriaceae bacterium]|nr:DNA repair protein RadC [Flavobacteriaceae bacterium]